MTIGCKVTQDLNRHMSELDEQDRRESAIEFKVEEVEKKFLEMAKTSGLDDACYWLAGAFLDEAINNAASIIIGIGGPNDYFETLIHAKAVEMVEADCGEPEAPDYDDIKG